MKMISISDRIYRGPRPSSTEMCALSQDGFKTILNLEGGIIEAMTRNSNYQEYYAHTYRLDSVRIAMNMILPPSPDDVFMALNILNDASCGKTYVHCKQGVDRTGFVIAVYRMKVQGWSYEAAVKELWSNGFHWWYAYWLPSLKPWERTFIKKGEPK